MAELFWLVRLGFAIFIAWKLVMMMEPSNPLMGMFFAVAFTIAAPFGMDALVELLSENDDFAGICNVLMSTRTGAPVAFGLVGVLSWCGIEAVTGR